MKVWIEPVPKPKSFDEVKFSAAEFAAAEKKGALQLAMVTAKEAVKYGKGLYRFRQNKPEVEMKVNGLSIDQMDSKQLLTMAMSLGVTIRKKNIKRSELAALVTRKMDEVVVTDDEEEVDTGEVGEE